MNEAVHPPQGSPCSDKLIELPLHPKKELRQLHMASETAQNGEAALAFVRGKAFRCLQCNKSKVEGHAVLPCFFLTVCLVHL